MACGDPTNFPPVVINPVIGNQTITTTSNSTGTVEMNMKFSDELVARDPFTEELKKIKDKKDNTYILLIRDGNLDPYPTPATDSIKTLVFDTFDACNVTEQIIRKDNFKKQTYIRKYFYHNNQFFEMSKVK